MLCEVTFTVRRTHGHTWSNSSTKALCVHETLQLCMLILSSTEPHCVRTYQLCRGRTLGGMGSWPSLPLFFNDQMAT